MYDRSGTDPYERAGLESIANHFDDRDFAEVELLAAITAPSDEVETYEPEDYMSYVHQECFFQIEQIITKARTSTDQLDDAQVPAVILCDMAQELAASNDLAGAEEHIAAIAKLWHGDAKLKPDEDLLTRACFAGISVGSVYAQETLHTALQKEKQCIVDKLEDLHKESPDVVPIVRSELLLSVLEYCRENDIVPVGWINAFSAMPEQQWELSLDYHASMVHDEVTGAYHQERTASLVSDFANRALFDEAHVFFAAKDVYQKLEDEELQSVVLERFLESIGDVENNAYKLNYLAETGATFIYRGELSPWAVTILDEAVERAFAEIKERNEHRDPVVIRACTTWTLAKLQYQEAGVESMVAALNAQTLDSPPDHLPVAAEDLDTIISERDMQLCVMIDAFIETDDFEALGPCIRAMGDIDMRGGATKFCLSKAISPDQVEALRPQDQFELALNADIASHVAFAHARIAGDTKAVVEVARQWMQAEVSGKPWPEAGYIQQAYDFVARADADAAISLAQEIVAAGRKAGIAYTILKEYSDVLIEAGNADEAAKVYDDIVFGETPMPRHVELLWDLFRRTKPRTDL